MTSNLSSPSNTDGEPSRGAASISAWVKAARVAGARAVLLIVGQPVALRIGEEVTTPFGPEILHYRDTQAIVESILPPNLAETLDRDGSVDAPFAFGEVKGTATVFFGQGSHNIVLHLGF